MIEYEKKMLLTKKEYVTLLMLYGENAKMTRQTNFYFDTEDMYMNARGITCRIRLKNGKYDAVMKCHRKASDESSMEIKMNVRVGLAENDFTDMGLRLQGHLETERTVLIKTDFYCIVLDKNMYLNCVDYELEIEYLEGYEEGAQLIMDRMMGVLTKKKANIKSKSERFFERRTAL